MVRRQICGVLLAVLAGAPGCAPERRGAGAGGPGDLHTPGTGGRAGGIQVPEGPCEPGTIACVGSQAILCGESGVRWERGDNCALRSNSICADGQGCVEEAGPDDPPGEGEGGDGEPGPEPEGEGEGEGDPGHGGEVDGEGEGEGEGGAGCLAGANACAANTLMYCLDDGQWVEQEDCAATGRTCLDGACVGCEAGERSCRGQRVVQCDAEGLREVTVETCPQGTRCAGGACATLCGADGDDKVSYQGCEYWAVDLDNADVDVPGGVSPADAQFAVVVSNVGADDVEVVAWRSDDGRQEAEVLRRTVRAGAVEVLELPPRSIVGSGKGFRAYRISASAAVIAYQFNPLNNTETAFSNDASLLIPSNALGTEYIAVTGDGLAQPASLLDPEPMVWGSYVTVVGVGHEPVDVTVEASTDIQSPAGPGVVVQGRRVTATLGRYEVLAVHSAPEQADFLRPPRPGNGNMSGTRVRATGPVAVFSGNVAISVPVREGLCCADHMEEQLWPVAAWGRTFVAARSKVRRPARPETDFWRITAAEDGTDLAYRPARPSGAPQRLSAGQSVEFESAAHFVVEATGPIQVAQLLASSGWVDPEGARNTECRAAGPAGDEECFRALGYLSACVEGRGMFGERYTACMPISDPALILTPPIEQFRDAYVFLAPRDYNTDFINVIAPAGATVNLDGQALPAGAWSEVAEADGVAWRVATVVVADGRHALEADAPVGLLVYGYDQDVSYGYPGGLDLERLE